MSCGACRPKGSSCSNQAKSRSHHTSDAEDSNILDSGYMSDMPGGEEFTNEQDDDCNDNGGGCNDNGGGCSDDGGGCDDEAGCCEEDDGGCDDNGGGCDDNGGGCNDNGGGCNDEAGCCEEDDGGCGGKTSPMSQIQRSSSNQNKNKSASTLRRSQLQTGSSQSTRSRRCSCSATDNQMQRQSSNQQCQKAQPAPKPLCPPPLCPPPPPPACSPPPPACPPSSQNSAKGSMMAQLNAPRVGSISQPYSGAPLKNNVSGHKSMGPSASFSFQQPSNDSQVQFNSILNTAKSPRQPACGGKACGQYGSQANGGQQSSFPASYNANGQNQGMRSSSKSNSRSNVNSCSAAPSQPKQVVASCCYQNKSMQSIASKNSRSGSQAQFNSGKPNCCDSKQDDSPAEEFVCPSCAEFENVDKENNSDDCEDDIPQNDNSTECANSSFEQDCSPDDCSPDDCCPDDDSPNDDSPNDCGSQFGTEQSREKPKKKNSNGGFWQQLQFQIFQQQDGEDEENSDQNDSGNNNRDPCLCDDNNDMQTSVKPKKSGNKVWQQLTLDIFQSKEDESSDGECGGDSSSKQGWQQQLKLQIFQEKLNSDGDDDQPAGNDNCVC